MRHCCAAGVALMVLGIGCGAPEPPEGTGGAALAPAVCGRGLAVVASDYQSTNVSLLSVDGEVLSSSFVSSASESAALSAPLSGDVVLPNEAGQGAELVLIDRSAGSVLSWIDLASAEVRAQLSVGTGFASNPQDYVLASERRAYVSRYARNASPGREPFDEGDDLLIVDPSVPQIVGRVDLSDLVPSGFLPRPGRMVRADLDRVYVLLAGYSSDFGKTAASRIVTIDTLRDEVRGVTELTGLHGCSALALEPQFEAQSVSPRLVVSCSGNFGGSSDPGVGTSGLAVLETNSELPRVVARFMADELIGQPLGFSVTFASASMVLVTALGSDGQGALPRTGDALLSVVLSTGEADVVMRSNDRAFVLGDVRCLTPLGLGALEAECGGCFVADAERSVLQRLHNGPSVRLGEAIEVDAAIGLPPRLLGRF